MAEEFALEKSLGDCPRIHAYHRSESPVRHPVDLSRKHIFSCTVLTCNKHSRICSGYLLDSLSYTAHRRTFAPEHLHGRRRDHGFFLLASPVVCRLQRFNQLVVVPRLHDEVECTSLHSLYSQLDVSVCGKQHDLSLRSAFLYLRKPIEAFVSSIYVGVEVHVQQHDIRTEVGQLGNQLLRRRNQLHLREMQRQQHLQCRPDAAVVIHNQYFCLAFCHNHTNIILFFGIIRRLMHF